MSIVRCRVDRGYSLLELSIVVALISLTAAIAMPSLRTAEDRQLVLARTDLANIVRFAREEARRTGVVHGVSVETTSNQVRLFRVDEVPDPNQKIFDVYNPVSRQLYTVNFDAARYGGISILALNSQAQGTCSDLSSLAFDSNSVPRCAIEIETRLKNAQLTVDLDGLNHSIMVDDYTGRVTPQ